MLRRGSGIEWLLFHPFFHKIRVKRNSSLKLGLQKIRPKVAVMKSGC